MQNEMHLCHAAVNVTNLCQRVLFSADKRASPTPAECPNKAAYISLYERALTPTPVVPVQIAGRASLRFQNIVLYF